MFRKAPKVGDPLPPWLQHSHQGEDWSEQQRKQAHAQEEMANRLRDISQHMQQLVLAASGALVVKCPRCETMHTKMAVFCFVCYSRLEVDDAEHS